MGSTTSGNERTSEYTGTGAADRGRRCSDAAPRGARRVAARGGSARHPREPFHHAADPRKNRADAAADGVLFGAPAPGRAPADAAGPRGPLRPLSLLVRSAAAVDRDDRARSGAPRDRLPAAPARQQAHPRRARGLGAPVQSRARERVPPRRASARLRVAADEQTPARGRSARPHQLHPRHRRPAADDRPRHEVVVPVRHPEGAGAEPPDAAGRRRVAAALSFSRRPRADPRESGHLGLPPEMHRAPERLTTMTVRMPDQESPPQGGASEHASFGEELRREREIRGISLKEISDATKISKRFLDALERNDHRTLPAPVFTRGFVREYARYVGLNAEDMVNRYNYAAA